MRFAPSQGIQPQSRLRHFAAMRQEHTLQQEMAGELEPGARVSHVGRIAGTKQELRQWE